MRQGRLALGEPDLTLEQLRAAYDSLPRAGREALNFEATLRFSPARRALEHVARVRLARLQRRTKRK